MTREVDVDVVRQYARDGDVQTLRTVTTPPICFIDAIHHGHLDVVKYLHEERGLPFASIQQATQLWYVRNRIGQGGALLCEEAAKGGHLHIIEYLHNNGCEWSVQTSQAAVSTSCDPTRILAILRYLHANQCPFNEFVLEKAIELNNLDIIKFLVEVVGLEWSKDIFNEAARLPTTDVIKYIHQCVSPKVPLSSSLVSSSVILDPGSKQPPSTVVPFTELAWIADETTTSSACCYNSVECLRYLHQHGCPIDTSCCDDAAEYGSIECCQYLHDVVGVTFSLQQLYLAAGAGQIDTCFYIFQRLSPTSGASLTHAVVHELTAKLSTYETYNVVHPTLHLRDDKGDGDVEMWDADHYDSYSIDWNNVELRAFLFAIVSHPALQSTNEVPRIFQQLVTLMRETFEAQQTLARVEAQEYNLCDDVCEHVVCQYF